MNKTNEAIKEACERSIVLAADGVEKLRVMDVMRVMEDFSCGGGDVNEMVDYISTNRSDLSAEAKACQMEIAAAV